MAEKDMLDSGACGLKTAKMWLDLGDQIAQAIPDFVIQGEPAKAIQWATCAEACWWKATGEAEAHDVKDILGPHEQAG